MIKNWNFIYYPPLILIAFAQLYGGVELGRSLHVESDLLDEQILVINRDDVSSSDLHLDSSYHRIEKRSPDDDQNSNKLIMVRRFQHHSI